MPLSAEKSVYNGIAIYPIPATMESFSEITHIDANGLLGKPLVLDKNQATRICNYLGKVLGGDFAGQVEFNSGGLDIKIKLKKFIENYHGGGAYKGVMGYSNFNFLGLLPRVTISRGSLMKFRASLAELYHLEVSGPNKT